MKTRKRVKKKPTKKRITKYFATYIGSQKHISLSPGVGKIMPGKPFEVKESVAFTLRQDPENFRVKEKYEYVDI